MSFFEDLGKKISQSGQEAVQKTRDMAETVRLNGMISDEERKIDALSLQVGRRYLEKYASELDDEFADAARQISDARAQVEVYREQIRKKKGISVCPNCGADVSYGAPFCSNCGSKQERPVTVPTPSEQNPAPFDETATGSEYAENSSSAASSTFAEQTFVEQTVVEQEKAPGTVCPRCNAALPEGVAFCVHCGQKIGAPIA